MVFPAEQRMELKEAPQGSKSSSQEEWDTVVVLYIGEGIKRITLAKVWWLRR